MGKEKKEEREKAFDLYCNTQLDQKEIALIAGVSPQQLSKWVNKGNWSMYREAQQVTIEKLIHGYYQQLAAINKVIQDNQNGIPTSSDTDKQVKLTGAIDALRKRYNLSSYYSVLREYLEWQSKAKAEMAKQFGPAMLEFLKEKAKKLNDDKNVG